MKYRSRLKWPLFLASVVPLNGCYSLGEGIAEVLLWLVILVVSVISIIGLVLLILCIRKLRAESWPVGLSVFSILFGIAALLLVGTILWVWVGDDITEGAPIPTMGLVLALGGVLPFAALVASIFGAARERKGVQIGLLVIVIPIVVVGLIVFWMCRPGHRIPSDQIVAVVPAFESSCILFENGRVACVGENSEGQLGLGHTRRVHWAQTIPGVTGVEDLKVGDESACGQKADGTLLCWGNVGGEKGRVKNHGPVEGFLFIEHTLLLKTRGRWKTLSGEEPFADLTDIAEIEGSSDFLCARTTNKQVYCNTVGDASQRVSELDGATDISVRNNQVCAIREAHILCGRSRSNFPSNTVVIDEYSKKTFDGPVQLARGKSHFCVLENNGQVKCWGKNNLCQLGLGDRIDRGQTVLSVPKLRNVKAISSSAHTICASRRGEEPVCWGRKPRGLSFDGEYVNVRSKSRTNMLGPALYGCSPSPLAWD